MSEIKSRYYLLAGFLLILVSNLLIGFEVISSGWAKDFYYFAGSSSAIAIYKWVYPAPPERKD